MLNKDRPPLLGTLPDLECSVDRKLIQAVRCPANAAAGIQMLLSGCVLAEWMRLPCQRTQWHAPGRWQCVGQSTASIQPPLSVKRYLFNDPRL